MDDKFFTQKYCDRCNAILHSRTMSWFTDETLCMDCSIDESNIKRKLPDNGKTYEGCGYIPKIDQTN